MGGSKHVAILIASLIGLHGARAQLSTTVRAGGEAFTLGDTATSTAVAEGGNTIEKTSTAPQIAQSTITSTTEPSTAAAGDLATVSITAAPGYQVAPACLQECLYFDLDGIQVGLYLPELLGCYTTVYNGCYCTSAVANQASSIISSCISKLCTGTAQISDAYSVYDAYCTSAGYPSKANAETTATTATAQVTVVTNNIVLTLTIGSSTILYTEPAGVQTQTLTSSSSSSANTNPASSNSNPKTNIAAIVGGIVGALVLIAVLLAVVFIWLPRRQKKKERQEAQAGLGSAFVPPHPPPVAAMKGGGRAELQEAEKGIPMVDVKEGKEMVQEVKGPVSGGGGGVEMDGRGVPAARYGLRPEELDSEGRYVGELHGDGRQFIEVELQGSEVRR